LNKKSVTIVGSRNASEYGKRNAGNIAYYLAKKDYVIISGLAIGIDTMAHIGALKAKGRTIAVLTHGLNKIYPYCNRQLAIEILKNNGTLISENPIGTTISKESFSYRDRIMSGLSMNTIIVEAKKESGSLITADYALSQGRDVYAIPGNIISQTSQGTNQLLKEGAKPVIRLYNEFYK